MKRECGNCSLCCVLAPVEDLNKPRGVRCEHLTDHGCGVYENRPAEVCSSFKCSWLLGHMPKSQKPNKTGVLIWGTSTGMQVLSEGPIPDQTWQWLMSIRPEIKIYVNSESVWMAGRRLVA